MICLFYGNYTNKANEAHNIFISHNYLKMDVKMCGGVKQHAAVLFYSAYRPIAPGATIWWDKWDNACVSLVKGLMMCKLWSTYRVI